MSSLLEELKELIMLPGVSGFEEQVRRHIIKKTRDKGKGYTDNMGNYYVEIGEGPVVLLAAHMDEIGLLVTKIDDEGRLRFRKIGGIDDRILPSMHVTVHTSKGPVPGVIGITPPHLALEAQPKILSWHELYIDIGAESKDEALDMGVRVLDPVTLEKPWSLLRNGEVVATRGLDDRIGCAVLLELLLRLGDKLYETGKKVVVAWTTQEEIGLRGAKALAHRVNADSIIVIDTFSCCSDLTGDVKPGRGPVLRLVDRGGFADPSLAKKIINIAEKNNIPLQIGGTGGMTDSIVFQETGLRSLPLGIAVNYSHSTVEKAYLRDIEWLIELLEKILFGLEL